MIKQKNLPYLNEKKIRKAILEIKQLQIKYAKANSIIVYHALGKTLDELGWAFATLLEKGK